METLSFPKRIVLPAIPFPFVPVFPFQFVPVFPIIVPVSASKWKPGTHESQSSFPLEEHAVLLEGFPFGQTQTFSH